MWLLSDQEYNQGVLLSLAPWITCGNIAMGNIRVLLIEDDILDAEQVLRSSNTVFPRVFDVVHVTRFLDAMDLIKKRSFQVIILDLGLPDNKGLKGVKTLMKLVPSVPVVVLTGIEDDDAAMEAISLGAQEFLSKNELAPNSLIRCIRHAIKRKQVSLEGPDQTQNANSLQLEKLTDLLKNVFFDVTHRVDELKKTELSTEQSKIVSEIEQITVNSAQSLAEITRERSMFVPLRTNDL